MKPAILIVDDSLTVRMDLAEIFASAGFAPTACETLSSARKALAGQQFSLVVLDILLPDGDGIDLLREIKTQPQTHSIPVMLLSTEVEVRDRVRGMKTGADDYVGKPYESNYLLARARHLIRSPGPDQRTAPSVLLIDDSATFCAGFREQVEAAGYAVACAGTGEEGLRTALALRPDIIVVDGLLPGGIDGATVIRRLKQDLSVRNIPCLLLTASEEAGEELAALDAGADAFLRKDTEIKVLLARLAALRRFGPQTASNPQSFGVLGATKILAVDDSKTFLFEICSQLRQEGYDVAPAHSGEEALELLEAQTVDCILLDLRMPGLSGEETCRIIKKTPAWKNIPLILLTAVEGSQAMVEGINAGADDYVAKSTDFDVLKARVRAQIRRKQFENEYRSLRDQLLRKELEATRERAAREISEVRARLVDELEKKNRELEAFTYSASHDLRAPLRAIGCFTKSVLEDFENQLPAGAKDYLGRVQAAATRMAQLIDALLELSHSGLSELDRQTVDISALARSVAEELANADPGRKLEFSVEEDLAASADAALLRVLLANLLGNAWKFTLKVEHPEVAVGALQSAERTTYFVRDNGAGFDSSRAKRLFQPFERLHAARDFPGAGIGLATVRRIVERHGGKVWAESVVGGGATFYFTLCDGAEKAVETETAEAAVV